MCVREGKRDIPELKPPVIGEAYSEEGFDFIDAGIRREVVIFNNNGIETDESCEGGPGHTFPEPTICFRGGHHVGLKALSVAMEFGLRPGDLRRVHRVRDGEIAEVFWEMTFVKPQLTNFYAWSKPD